MNLYISNFVLLIIIFILLLIILLQYLKLRKNISVFKRIKSAFKIGKYFDYKSIVDIIDITESNHTSSISNEGFELISNYIKKLVEDSRVFIHVTKTKEIADKILAEGFKYSDSFDKTTSEVSSNDIELIYKLQVYKHYGRFVIIICLPRNSNHEVKKENLNLGKDFLFERGISEHNHDDELFHILPNRYLKAYIDIDNLKVIENKTFNVL